MQKSKELSFLNSLLSGRTITRKQAMAQFKLKNPSATVHRLLMETGFLIKRTYKDKKISGNLKTQTVRYYI
jgi:hypothetical protein